MSVRDQDQVCGDSLSGGRGLRVARQERIDQHVLAPHLEQEARMIEPLHAGRHDRFALDFLSTISVQDRPLGRKSNQPHTP